MALCRYTTGLPETRSQKRWGWVSVSGVTPLDDQEVARCFTAPGAEGLEHLAYIASSGAEQTEEAGVTLEAPLSDGQEVWAAGVTYESSKFARMAESPEGGDFYSKVYTADRPELFFKATPSRTVGPKAEVRIRADSAWNVPEPELAVVIAANGQILGYTVGNDMSSRDIEGANPLYLPQAKVYRGSCALGPVIIPAGRLDPHNLGITLTISRAGSVIYKGETSTSRMRRKVEELAGWLFRENDFPHGVILLTGTGLIPPEEFSLQAGDNIAIEIEGIGSLRNTVAAS